ncbi:MAG: transglycosylase SLT domain-containing protein [Saprospiraceae bacterium]|nr:transglycosylase SLT domain-containing protein [Saprospiraceae bacterium]
MNTFMNITKNFVIVCFLNLVSITAFTKSPNNAEIITRLESLNTIIDMRITEEVLTQVNYSVEKWRYDSQVILGRSSMYFPVIENILREKNLPEDLKYIAVIESALLPRAKSRQGASGMWQFMEGTAEMYGLNITRHIDERRDIIKSTEKATDYLQLLYETYGSWTLALAAYNCGTGRVNKAIKKSGGSKNYWTVAEHLPTETKKYIPRFIAAMYLLNYYYHHDLNPIQVSDELRYTFTVKIFKKTDLKQLSEDLELDYNLIQMLNPIYVKDHIPAPDEDKYYTLTLPDHKMLTYFERYKSSGDLVYNPLAQKRPDLVSTGIEIVTPRPPSDYITFLTKEIFMTRDNLKDSSIYKHLPKGVLPGREKLKLYQLGKKESLADVAETNNIPLADLISINNIDESKGIAPGSIIILTR